MKKKCKESQTEIEVLVTEGLVPARREKLDAHVEMCGKCLKYFSEARRDAEEVRAVVDKTMEMFTDEEVDKLILWLKVAFSERLRMKAERLRMDAEVNKRKLEGDE